MLGDFEVIDFVDEDAIANVRNHLQIDAPVSVNWQWDYGSEVSELRALYEKGKQNQWNASTDLDWDSPVSKDEWFLDPETSMMAQVTKLMGRDEATQKAAMFDEANWIMSQLLHGEQAALQLCGQLTNICPKTDEKWYAANQVADEARHNEVIARFLSDKMGTIYPIAPTIKVLLDSLLAAEGYHMKTLGMQTLFEGMAVGIMDGLRENTRNPLFRELLRKVEQDEARHAAFGVLTMRRCVKEASPEKRDHMEDFAFAVLEAFNANQQLDMLNVIGPKLRHRRRLADRHVAPDGELGRAQLRDLHAHGGAQPGAARTDHGAHARGLEEDRSHGRPASGRGGELIRRLVSGAQTGADRAALDAALALGIEVGGWVPKGRRAEDGAIPERYPNLVETGSADYSVRTRANVRDSDATVIVSRGPLEGGSALTLEFTRELLRPCLHVDLSQLTIARAATVLAAWLDREKPETLNVAGPRASKDPTIHESTKRVLSLALASLNAD